MISPRSVFFLMPMTMAHDHMPMTQCTALSERARSQSFCCIIENCRSLSATRQNTPRPRLEIRDSVLQDWSKARVFSVSGSIPSSMSACIKSHQEIAAYTCLHSQSPFYYLHINYLIPITLTNNSEFNEYQVSANSLSQHWCDAIIFKMSSKKILGRKARPLQGRRLLVGGVRAVSQAHDEGNGLLGRSPETPSESEKGRWRRGN